MPDLNLSMSKFRGQAAGQIMMLQGVPPNQKSNKAE